MKKKRIFYLCSFKFRRVLPAVLKKRFSIPNGLKKVRMQTEARGNRARSRRCKFCLKLGRYTTVKILLWEGASREVLGKTENLRKKARRRACEKSADFSQEGAVERIACRSRIARRFLFRGPRFDGVCFIALHCGRSFISQKPPRRWASKGAINK